jgi:hypothetical protein
VAIPRWSGAKSCSESIQAQLLILFVLHTHCLKNPAKNYGKNQFMTKIRKLLHRVSAITGFVYFFIGLCLFGIDFLVKGDDVTRIIIFSFVGCSICLSAWIFLKKIFLLPMYLLLVLCLIIELGFL